MSDDTNVIQLHEAARDRDAPIRERRDPTARPPRECRCLRTEIVPERRQLVCRDCGQLVEAFDFLLKLAQDDGRWRAARDAAEREARLAKKRVDNLQLEERRAKGRLRSMAAQEREIKRRLDLLDAELRAFSPDTQSERKT